MALAGWVTVTSPCQSLNLSLPFLASPPSILASVTHLGLPSFHLSLRKGGRDQRVILLSLSLVTHTPLTPHLHFLLATRHHECIPGATPLVART